MSFNVGDKVAIKGQSGSVLTVAEVGTGISNGKYRCQNASQSGAKGTWYHGNKLVPYGADTGKESPMGGKPVNPDNGRSSTHAWFRER